MFATEEIELTQKDLLEVKERLRRRWIKKLKAGEKQIAEAQKLGGERLFLSCGEVKMMIAPVHYHYWGQRLGYGCWEDPTWIEEFLRDNPVCRVKSRPKNFMLGWQKSNKRFHKIYKKENYKRKIA